MQLTIFGSKRTRTCEQHLDAGALGVWALVVEVRQRLLIGMKPGRIQHRCERRLGCRANR